MTNLKNVEAKKHSYISTKIDEQKLAYIKNVRNFFPGSELIYLNDGSPRVIHNNKDISTILMPIPKNALDAWMQASSWTDFKRADSEYVSNDYSQQLIDEEENLERYEKNYSELQLVA